MPTHSEQRVLPYTAEQLFALVADVERYPEFLPWCLGAHIHERRPDRIDAELVIGFRLLRERFISRVTLDPPRRIDVTYEQGPFEYLNSYWIFTPIAGGCRIDFFVDFEFRSRLLKKVMGVVFGEAVRRMVGAFEKRACELYGAPVARRRAGSKAPT
jgi:coenzyme Q-binding protein COQ10